MRALRISILVLFAALALAFTACPSALAWGCEGHLIIAYVAEAHLSARARAAAIKILSASPIDPGLSRYCRPRNADPFVDASTWADDYRSVDPETAAWHFIDIPRGAHRGRLARYCPPARGCVVSALEEQLRVLKNPRASATARADALRFIIHLVGDIHQPLHDVTNDDLGGNCVPVEFLGAFPMETNVARELFEPNLHQIWDVSIIGQFGRGNSALRVAMDLNRNFRLQIAGWESQPVDFAAWAWEGHALADAVAYGKLPRAVPVEPPRFTDSCADGNIGLRMFRLHENLGPAYESVAAPVVQQQLAKAGARLAHVLNSALQ
jgi:hypothetical protein